MAHSGAAGSLSYRPQETLGGCAESDGRVPEWWDPKEELMDSKGH